MLITISNMGNFNGDSQQQLIVICAGMVGIVIWATAAMHGAQDGLKFIGVFMLATSFVEPSVISANGSFIIPIWLMIYCSLIMGLGTSIGGYKIIKTVIWIWLDLNSFKDLFQIFQQ